MDYTDLGPAMALSYAEEQGKKAQRQASELAVRVRRLERLFVLATMGGKDAQAETNGILRDLIKDAGS